MANNCKGCTFFRKETIEINRVGNSYNTYIEMDDPLDPTTSYEIAQCSNQTVTEQEITRDSSTDFFFTDEKYTNLYEGIIVVGENDLCPYFNAIP